MATQIQFQPHDALGRITSYFMLINSMNEQTTQLGYVNRNTIVMSDEATVKQEWRVFSDLIETIKPYIKDTFKKVKIDRKNKMAKFTTRKGTKLEIVFTTTSKMKDIRVDVAMSANNYESTGVGLSVLNGTVDDIAKEAKKRKLF